MYVQAVPPLRHATHVYAPAIVREDIQDMPWEDAVYAHTCNLLNPTLGKYLTRSSLQLLPTLSAYVCIT